MIPVVFATPLSDAHNHARYDVVPNAAEGKVPTKEGFRQRLQTLLADRFLLKVHRRQKEMAVYSLIAGPKGPKLKESAPETKRHWLLGGKGRNYEVTMRNVSM